MRDKQQQVQLKDAMDRYTAHLAKASKACTSATASDPAAVAAALEAYQVYQGRLLGHLLARRPAAQYTALLRAPTKRRVNTEEGGATREEVRRSNTGRPFKHKRWGGLGCCLWFSRREVLGMEMMEKSSSGWS